MKKILSIILSLMLCIGLVGCSSTSNDDSGNSGENTSGAEIAMITDIGTIDDKSFNQGTWEGIVAYAKENNITHEYYKPLEQTTDAYLDAIELAVQGGAKIVVTPGYLFEEPIYIAQDKYPDVNFILIDGNPHNADYSEYRTNDNAVGIVFAEEQSGYLAGYAAVKDGYTELGFMGGMAVPAVIRFGYGFVQGADAAAKELNIDNVNIKYHYTGGFDATPEVQTLASSWYTDGTEVIFACGGAVGNSVMSAAEAIESKKVIGVDVDQGSESDTVITSAMKGLAASVQQTLEQYYSNEFPGGEALVLGADLNGVNLPIETSKFNTFTTEEYNKVFEELANGNITLQKDEGIESATNLDLNVVTVKVIK